MSFIKLLCFWIDPYIDMNFEGSSCDTFNIRNLEQHGPRNSISLATPLLTVILTATCFWAWSVLGLGLFAGTITVQRDIIKIQNRHTKFQNRAIRETITFPVTQWGCWKMYALCSNGKVWARVWVSILQMFSFRIQKHELWLFSPWIQ